MSDNIKDNKEKISNLRSFIISQLKTSAWEPLSSESFSNEYIRFTKDGAWKFAVYYKKYDSSDRFFVSDFINPITFWFLRVFYVNPSLKNYEKFKKESYLASVSQKFFTNNKELDRDSKLDKILN